MHNFLKIQLIQIKFRFHIFVISKTQTIFVSSKKKGVLHHSPLRGSNKTGGLAEIERKKKKIDKQILFRKCWVVFFFFKRFLLRGSHSEMDSILLHEFLLKSKLSVKQNKLDVIRGQKCQKKNKKHFVGENQAQQLGWRFFLFSFEFLWIFSIQKKKINGGQG